jgi:tight adherence protein B
MQSIDAIIAVFALGFLFIIWKIISGGSQKQMQKRIERLQQRKSGAAQLSPELSLRRQTQQAQGLLYWMMRPLPNLKKLGYLLERAGKTISPQQFTLRCLLAMILIFMLIAVLLKKSVIIAFSVAVIAAVWLPIKVLQISVSKQSKRFLRLFPDAIDLIVRGLRSGLPVSESIVLVGNEVPDPVGAVFRNITNTMKLGVPMEKALLETANKLNLTEFNFFTTSIIIQRETGGNLSEILGNLSEVLRGRFIMQMKIKAMSSEARASAYIVGALPFFVTLVISVMSPKYMQPLIDDPRGNICVGIAVGMMIFGGWVMNRMTKFEI